MKRGWESRPVFRFSSSTQDGVSQEDAPSRPGVSPARTGSDWVGRKKGNKQVLTWGRLLAGGTKGAGRDCLTALRKDGTHGELR